MRTILERIDDILPDIAYYCHILIPIILVGVIFIILMDPSSYKEEQMQIGRVNITSLIDRFIKQEAKKNLPQDVLRKEVEHYGINLNKELQLLSKTKHVILFPSEAVIAGSKDYTSYIEQVMLSKKENKNE